MNFVKESAEVVRDVVSEEASIVSEAVADGAQFAAESVSTVGELSGIEGPDRSSSLRNVGFWVSVP